MESDLYSISDKLRQDYSKRNHFSFVGYTEICAPLFGVKVKQAKVQEIDLLLREKYGIFLIQLPDYFT